MSTPTRTRSHGPRDGGTAREVLRQWWQARMGDADLPQVEPDVGFSCPARRNPLGED